MAERGWLIDTNVVSELRKGRRAHPAVRYWAESVPPVACHISRVSLAEIRCGIERVDDPGFRAELEDWMLDAVRPWFGPRIVELSEAVLVRWRHMALDAKREGYTYAQPDALIAASALENGLAVATRNVVDFVRAGVRTFNPWDAVPVRP